IDLNLISGYSHHIMRQPMKFFEMRQVGEILSRVNDAANIREAISGTTLTMIVDATLVIISMVVMFIYDTNLAWVACAFIPVFLIAVWAHHPPTRRLSRNVMESSANLQSHLVENISGADTTKAFGAEKRRGDEADDRLVKVVQSIFRLQKLNVSMSTIGMFITGAAGIVILWVGGHRVIDRALTIGELMFFYSLLGYMLDPLQRLSTVNLSIQDALVAVDRVGEIMDMESEKLHEDTKADITEIKEGMELRDTHFAYGSRAEVLKKVNIKIPVGKTIAIVGESGCGKSTLLKLLPRFYDPTKGQVILDGTDLRDIRLSSLRSKVGLVSQDTFLFTGSIQENIAFGRTDATMDEVTAAAKSAGLAKFINELPERYETLLGERGANFSGGQRQRLAIARVLLTRPEIIVFDEATSHLDTETELVIQKSIEENLKGRTIVMVAHRLSTICNADLIYVMHEGEIVEQGTHSELLKVGGRYSKLWRVQANDVIETRFRILDPEKRRSTDE
ncbi:MAG: peptidase domain-containing ABC transporter, partial [Planctomycetota bacterium]|nr:peptidase domain-containing ABC transporter [Planctomycetota bacterium]